MHSFLKRVVTHKDWYKNGRRHINFTAVEEIPYEGAIVVNNTHAQQRIDSSGLRYETDTWSLPGVFTHQKIVFKKLTSGKTKVTEHLTFDARHLADRLRRHQRCRLPRGDAGGPEAGDPERQRRSVPPAGHALISCPGRAEARRTWRERHRAALGAFSLAEQPQDPVVTDPLRLLGPRLTRTRHRSPP